MSRISLLLLSSLLSWQVIELMSQWSATSPPQPQEDVTWPTRVLSQVRSVGSSLRTNVMMRNGIFGFHDVVPDVPDEETQTMTCFFCGWSYVRWRCGGGAVTHSKEVCLSGVSSMVLQWRWCGRKWPHVYRCSHRLNTLEGENDMKVIDLGLSPETWPSAVEVFHFFGSCLMFPHPDLSPSVVKSADWARLKDSQRPIKALTSDNVRSGGDCGNLPAAWRFPQWPPSFWCGTSSEPSGFSSELSVDKRTAQRSQDQNNKMKMNFFPNMILLLGSCAEQLVSRLT